MKREDRSPEQKNLIHEVFILAISILAILNVLIIILVDDPDMDQVLIIVNFVLSLILLVDFCYRFFTSKDKVRYFVYRYGWLDLLGSIPVFWMPVFRLLRILRVLRYLRQTGMVAMITNFRSKPASSVLASVSFLVLLVIQFGSYLVIGAEARSVDANIIKPLDSLWWALVTVTTVGYGDKYPVTILGRVIGAMVILLGVIMFSVLTSFFTSKFYEQGQAGSEKLLTTAELDRQELRGLLERQTRTLEQIESRLDRIEKKMNREID
jgi:voltage-gated potassium channel Kch